MLRITFYVHFLLWSSTSCHLWSYAFHSSSTTFARTQKVPFGSASADITMLNEQRSLNDGEELDSFKSLPSSFSNQQSSRRNIFKSITSTSVAFSLLGVAGTSTQSSIALDMDAFMNKELEGDKTKSEISDDVKTCKYAAPGKEKGDACVRAGISIAGKNGGVDAYGRINRGDYVRCKTSYPMIDGKYVKTVTCE